MRISRIPAEAGKALEPRRDGKTAHNLQQPRYLAIISRRLAPLNEKWGKSRKARGTLEVSGTKVKWLEKGKIVRGFEMKWAEFANFMVKNGKAV